MKTKPPFLLVGVDCEGDRREIEQPTLRQAMNLAGECSTGKHAWRSWEIWGNHPQTENWEALETSGAK